tara:strand:- start:376 stop:591 length:216 start_codon:yes stop_codon:yes gene_type:complete
MTWKDEIKKTYTQAEIILDKLTGGMADAIGKYLRENYPSQLDELNPLYNKIQEELEYLREEVLLTISGEKK